ncbi:MAG: gamma-glutamylcyclotransferase [Firmicutes bacterium]|nr:gamma-glutamylcyclotransferase [Bacillota bacterium]
MQKNTKLYIAYGSNMNIGQMQRRCPTAKVVTNMYLEGHRLRFMGSHYGAVATIEPSPDDLVPVTIWEICPDDEQSLDAYEGYPRLYRKETMKIKLGKKTFSAMIYIMNSEKMIYGQPSEPYFETIREGYINAGFDPKLLHQAVAENCVEVKLYG